MTQAKVGDTVKVHYTGRLEDGTVFDTSANQGPLEFTLGEGQVIPGFEEAVVGMTAGETKSSTVPAEKAYGPYREDRLMEVNRNQFPQHIQPEVGQRLQIRQNEDQTTIVTVAEVSNESVVLDANHPLAGKELTFDIQLMDIA